VLLNAYCRTLLSSPKHNKPKLKVYKENGGRSEDVQIAVAYNPLNPSDESNHLIFYVKINARRQSRTA
jgi:hypothetical protein